MSRIQEALRRIQALDRQQDRTSTSQRNEEQERIGTLSHRQLTEADIAAGNARSDRYVEIDRRVLRDHGLLAPEDQERFVADQYRLVKRPILDNLARDEASAGDDPMNLVMVASALPGDGKTFNCLNLALSMATEKDHSVLLVDADVAKPHISSLLNIQEERGLIDLLEDRDDDVESAIIDTDVPGLRVLSAGRADSHATELLASRRMANLVGQLASSSPGRVVIFDSPPILATSEARVLASLMGQIVLVVSAGHTPQAAVMEALENLDQDKAINLVLNRAAASAGLDGYGMYGYGYGYRPMPEKDQTAGN